MEGSRHFYVAAWAFQTRFKVLSETLLDNITSLLL